MLGQTEKLHFIGRDEGNVKEEDNFQYSLNPKKAKIIVRNLPFKNLSEDKLKQWFSEYGDISEVTLLRKDDGRFVGCGFVQFTNVASAAKAINKANQRNISGRTIIVDWAVPKSVYLKSIKPIKTEIKKELKDDESDSGNELPYYMDTTPNAEEVMAKMGQRNNSDDSDDSDSDVENDECDNINNVPIRQNNSGKKLPFQSNDVNQGKTIFVRNLAFSVTNDELKKCFSQFGSIEYAIVCIDKLTEHSRGSGFVKFKDKASAEYCLQQNNKISLEDRPLLLSLAVNRQDIGKNKTQKVGKDSRNLYLAKEGVITAGSPAARGVSSTDMAKRSEIEQWKSQMLKNLNMFISDRRLVVHNLPQSYDDAKLKAVFAKHSPPNAVVTESKVMRDKKKFDGKTGLGISKEFGFVTFTTHDDALIALRNINNNPKIFSVKKRPIVAFSVESKAALNAKKKRLEKSRMKLGINEDKTMKLNRKQRRFIKRRDEFIERRKAKKMNKETKTENPKKRKIDVCEQANSKNRRIDSC